MYILTKIIRIRISLGIHCSGRKVDFKKAGDTVRESAVPVLDWISFPIGG